MVEQNQQEQEKEETLATPGVIDKYQQAGKIANSVLEQVLKQIKAGVNVVDITAFGDNEINNQLKKVYKNKKNMEKGIAFPTCLSINEVCGHYSPLASDATDKEKSSASINAGDVVKIDLGVHIDGYIALVGHTVVCPGAQNEKITGRKADVILAAYNILQSSLRLLRPGCKNSQVTQNIQKISDTYKCNPLEGVLSHELKKHLIDGNACIINKEAYDQKVDEHEFGINEVYALDIIVSTGEGKTKESELRTTVYKRALEKTYSLKTKAGRTFMYEMIEKYPSLCFSIRSFEDEITSKLGVNECQKHDLLINYPVLVEKQGEIVAQFKYTVMILQGGTKLVTGLPINVDDYQSEYKIEDEQVLSLLSQSMEKTEQKKEKVQKQKQQQDNSSSQQSEEKKQ